MAYTPSSWWHVVLKTHKQNLICLWLIAFIYFIRTWKLQDVWETLAKWENSIANYKCESTFSMDPSRPKSIHALASFVNESAISMKDHCFPRDHADDEVVKWKESSTVIYLT